jgi:hypothetical protein
MICPMLKGKTFEEDFVAFCPKCEHSHVSINSEYHLTTYDHCVVIPLKCDSCNYEFAFKLVIYNGKY